MSPHQSVVTVGANLHAYRRAVQGLLTGQPGAREEVERAREHLASPPLIESLLAYIGTLEHTIAQACSCGASVLPCPMHGEASKPPTVTTPASPWCERCHCYHPTWATCGTAARETKTAAIRATSW